MQLTKIKITVVKRFGPEDVFGTNHNIRTTSGKLIEKCHLFNEDDEIIVDDLEARRSTDTSRHNV